MLTQAMEQAHEKASQNSPIICVHSPIGTQALFVLLQAAWKIILKSQPASLALTKMGMKRIRF